MSISLQFLPRRLADSICAQCLAGDVNDYSPIYDEYTWSQGGDLYALGTKGLTAWGALLVALLGISGYLIVNTSML